MADTSYDDTWRDASDGLSAPILSATEHSATLVRIVLNRCFISLDLIISPTKLDVNPVRQN